MSVRPLRLPDTVTPAGFDHIDSMTQWFLGGSGTAGAEATGINDDDRYGLDVQNVGAGGKALRAISGNGTHQARVDNTGVTFMGAIGFTGTTTFVSPVFMQSTLGVTGIATFVTSVSVGGAFSATGVANFSNNMTVAGDIRVDDIVALGDVTIGNDLTVAQDLSVTGPSIFGAAVVMQSSLAVTGTANFGGNMTAAGDLRVDDIVALGDVTVANDVVISQTLAVTGTSVFIGLATFGDVVMDDLTADGDVSVNNDLFVSQDLTVNGNCDIGSSSTDAHIFNGLCDFNDQINANSYISFGLGSDTGFDLNVSTVGTDHVRFDGWIAIRHNGNNKWVGYFDAQP